VFGDQVQHSVHVFDELLEVHILLRVNRLEATVDLAAELGPVSLEELSHAPDGLWVKILKVDLRLMVWWLEDALDAK